MEHMGYSFIYNDLVFKHAAEARHKDSIQRNAARVESFKHLLHVASKDLSQRNTTPPLLSPVSRRARGCRSSSSRQATHQLFCRIGLALKPAKVVDLLSFILQ